MKNKPSAPERIYIPSPVTTSDQQVKYNKEAALQSRAMGLIDQYSPEGSIRYSQTGEEVEGIPTIRMDQTLSPEQRGLYDAGLRMSQDYANIAEAQLGRVGETLSSPFDISGIGDVPTPSEATRLAARESILQRALPQLDRRREQLETSLANQGFTYGSEGWNEAMDEDNRRRNDLLLAADMQAGGEMDRLFGLETADRDRRINELAMLRNIPIGELAALRAGSVPGAPQFLQTPSATVAAPDYQTAAYASANQAANQANQAFQAENQYRLAQGRGLYGIGESALLAGSQPWKWAVG